MRRPVFLLLLVLLLIAPLTALAQTGGPLPPVPPSEGEVAPPPPEAAPTPVHRKRTRKRRRRHVRAPAVETLVEPANARLKVKTVGAPIFARASTHSERIGTLSADKYVQVTGSTKSYLQVQLKDGRIGYIQPSSVYLVNPYDKEFLLTADAPVLAAPNQFAKKLAEVHRGRYVHVIGQALNYLKIRMKDGTEGFVTMSAAQ